MRSELNYLISHSQESLVRDAQRLKLCHHYIQSHLLKMFRLDRFYRDVICGATIENVAVLNLQDRKNLAAHGPLAPHSAVTWGFPNAILTREQRNKNTWLGDDVRWTDPDMPRSSTDSPPYKLLAPHYTLGKFELKEGSIWEGLVGDSMRNCPSQIDPPHTSS